MKRKVVRITLITDIFPVNLEQLLFKAAQDSGLECRTINNDEWGYPDVIELYTKPSMVSAQGVN